MTAPSAPWTVPVLSYPWPEAVSPLEHDEALRREELSWLAEFYAELPAADRERYGRQGLSLGAAAMFPYVGDLARMRPIARYMLWLAIWDDHHESGTAAELTAVCDRAVEIMRGAEPAADEAGPLRLLAVLRRELGDLPGFWTDRWIASFRACATHGLLAEAPFRQGLRRMPALAGLELIREYSIGLYPFFHMTDAARGRVLPDDLYHHPAVQRSLALLCRICTLQNDLYSLRKELDAPTSDLFNAVLLLQRERGGSLTEAITEVVAHHDRYVRELDSLLRHLSDLDPRLAAARPYVEQTTLIITGIDRWYRSPGTGRYRPDGFAQEVPRGAALPG
ncbi:hypothetical protein ABT354_12900 [Streptomyces sp. NPDC000594]|uniref:terpene synthase family protein n=1 Tax=Streptomyces sp. NPDC000594 TaxID=3154261 RepID=UPI0033201951